MDDIEAAAAASDKAAAVAAWQAGAEYINAFIGLVNRNITPKVRCMQPTQLRGGMATCSMSFTSAHACALPVPAEEC
eukprot:4859533-Pleurochrysis_carterae.AAC.2